jgi:FkbM family methyltransferase
MKLKKVIRTVQNNFPFLLEAKFSFMRKYRRFFKIPFDEDFEAIPYFLPQQGSLFLDIGGNRGQSTDAILMKTHPQSCNIQIFEPNPNLAQKLSQQYSNIPTIIVNSVGLGDSKFEIPLYIPWYKGWMYDGLASFIRKDAENWLKRNLYFFDEKSLSIQEVICKVVQLDELQVTPFFMKIDVQGYEFNVLKGGKDTIEQHSPIILIENPTDQIINFLSKIGYKYYKYDNRKFIRNIKGVRNTYFIPDNKLVNLNLPLA